MTLAVTIHDVRLPDDIEEGATGGPAFLTNVVSISSGAEQRNASWSQSRITWNVGFGTQYQDRGSDDEGYFRILQFFYARQGMLYGFLFKDWSDFEAEDEAIATGDGVQTVYHLQVLYGDDENNFVRYITRPDWDTVVISVDGVALSASDWTASDKGALIFDVAPTGDITWTGEFLNPVRFNTDQFGVTLEAISVGSIAALPVIEIREDPNLAPISISLANQISIAENTSTASRVFVADVVIADDGLGTNVVEISGADAAYFEYDDDLAKLYIVAGTVLNYEVKSSYSITLSAADAFLDDAAVTVGATISITDVNEAPTIALTNEVHNLALGTSTVAHVLLADIAVANDALGTNVLSLTGTDAADFELTGTTSGSGSYTAHLYLKAGTDTSVAVHKTVNLDLNDASLAGSPDTREVFTLSIGVVAAVHDYDTAGDFTLLTPEYNTLTIEVWSPGAGTHGFSTSATTAPTAATVSRVQNDQTVTALERWRIAPFLPDNASEPYTPATKVATAKMDSFGIGATLDSFSGGTSGGIGYSPLTTAYPGRELPSGKGGDGSLDAAPVAGGAAQTVDISAHATGVTVYTADGADGDDPGAGASGGAYAQTKNVTTFSISGSGSIDDVTDAGMAGAEAGFYAKKIFTWGDVQVGIGDDYEASAPALGATLYIKVGTGGVGGVGTVTGGNGGLGKVRITVA